VSTLPAIIVSRAQASNQSGIRIKIIICLSRVRSKRISTYTLRFTDAEDGTRKPSSIYKRFETAAAASTVARSTVTPDEHRPSVGETWVDELSLSEKANRKRTIRHILCEPCDGICEKIWDGGEIRPSFDGLKQSGD
jgi:hypothetical protein